MWGTKRMKRREAPSRAARRFICASYLIFPVPALPSYPPDRYVKLSWGLNNPSPFWLEKLHTNGIAFAMQWVAICNASRRTKLTSAGNERQAFAFIPAAHADHPRATRTHIFCKSRFHSGIHVMPVKHDGNLHGNAPVRAVKRKASSGPRFHRELLTNTPRCAREIEFRYRGFSFCRAPGRLRREVFPGCRHPPETRQCRR
jgi:hypothetical protein